MNLLKISIYILAMFSLIGCGGSSNSDHPGASNGTSSKAELYWSTSSSVNGVGGIYKTIVNDVDDFTQLRQSTHIITVSVVASNGDIYWADATNGTIVKSDAEGNNVQAIISGLSYPNGLVLDEVANRLYISDNGQVGFTDLNAYSLQNIIPTGLATGGHLAIYGDNLYIADLGADTIQVLDLVGNTLSPLISTNNPSQMVIDTVNEKLIWVSSGDDNIYSVELDGANDIELIAFNDTFANPIALAIDNTEELLYFVIEGNVLQSSDLEGQDIKTLSTAIPIEVTSLCLIPEDN